MQLVGIGYDPYTMQPKETAMTECQQIGDKITAYVDRNVAKEFIVLAKVPMFWSKIKTDSHQNGMATADFSASFGSTAKQLEAAESTKSMFLIISCRSEFASMRGIAQWFSLALFCSQFQQEMLILVFLGVLR